MNKLENNIIQIQEKNIRISTKIAEEIQEKNKLIREVTENQYYIKNQVRDIMTKINRLEKIQEQKLVNIDKIDKKTTELQKTLNKIEKTLSDLKKISIS